MRNLMSAIVVACVCCLASVAQAQNFRFSYGNRGQAITGYVQPNYFGGYNAYGYDTSGNSYRFNYQAPFYPSYGYPVYRAPVMNDYYRQSPYQGYGFKPF